jgi:hypothetical protein
MQLRRLLFLGSILLIVTIGFGAVPCPSEELELGAVVQGWPPCFQACVQQRSHLCAKWDQRCVRDCLRYTGRDRNLCIRSCFELYRECEKTAYLNCLRCGQH